MLEGPFYSVISYTPAENGAKTRVKLNRESAVFQGHFPETPIVPGVCSIQMVHELIEKATSGKLKLVEADNIKFLGIINPDETPEIDIEITFSYDEQKLITTIATIGSNGAIFLKFKGKFKC